MSRKRDSNWSKEEITVLLDAIVEIASTPAENGGQNNSKQVFEYASKKMAEHGHHGRAEPEKCRTKWKKIKEEYIQAKRAREGESRCREAPGITPFYDRIEEFINGTHQGISATSTLCRKPSTTSYRRSNRNPSRNIPPRTSARIAANSIPISPLGPSRPSLSATRQNSRLNGTDSDQLEPMQQTLSNGDISTFYNETGETTGADISYRVSNGCRQITIFGDHDVDIKFRGDCVTINKIDNHEYVMVSDQNSDTET